jgi:hypothetical protein
MNRYASHQIPGEQGNIGSRALLENNARIRKTNALANAEAILKHQPQSYRNPYQQYIPMSQHGQRRITDAYQEQVKN